MSTLRPLLGVPIVLFLAACSGGATGSPGPSASPAASGSGSPSPSPADLGIEHPTGPTDVILRMESGGGFAPIGAAATQAPSFTLYGDGTLIARDDTAPWADPGPDGLIRLVPFYQTRLVETDVQGLLQFALGEGGLGLARPTYESGGIADAPSTFFTLRAGGLEKSVVVNALGFDAPESPDAAIRKAFAALADRLNSIAAQLPANAAPYQAERWRGTLMEAGMGGATAPIAWPWPDVSPTDFVVADSNGGGFPKRILTADEVEALGLGDLGGGVQDVSLLSPDSTSGYTLGLRPLFPDETS
jgi:hypothetical protein